MEIKSKNSSTGAHAPKKPTNIDKEDTAAFTGRWRLIILIAFIAVIAGIVVMGVMVMNMIFNPTITIPDASNSTTDTTAPVGTTTP